MPVFDEPKVFVVLELPKRPPPLLALFVLEPKSPPEFEVFVFDPKRPPELVLLEPPNENAEDWLFCWLFEPKSPP